MRLRIFHYAQSRLMERLLRAILDDLEYAYTYLSPSPESFQEAVFASSSLNEFFVIKDQVPKQQA